MTLLFHCIEMTNTKREILITVKEKVRAKSSKSSTFMAVATVVVAAAAVVVVVNFEDFKLKMLLFETRLDIICQNWNLKNINKVVNP